jgi:drug/metabolite transporter (DMT)-like permease
MNQITKAHLALLGANLFYGAGFTIAKTVMPSLIQPYAFIFIRVGCASILFWFTYLLGSQFRQKIERKDWGRLLLCSFFGIAANQLLFFKGLSITSPIHGSLMMLITPIVVTLLVASMGTEKLKPINYIGLCLGVIGAGVLVLSRNTNTTVQANSSLGDFFIFLNAVCYSIYLVMVKPLMAKYRPLVIIRWIFLIGFVMVIPFGLEPFTRIQWHTFSVYHFLAIAFIVICVTFFTYLWNIYALRLLPSSVAGAYIYLQPLFAGCIAVYFFNEAITFEKIVTAILIFLGVYLVTKKN